MIDFEKIPNKIRISGCYYDLILSEHPLLLNGFQCHGICDAEAKTIEMNKLALSKQSFIQTLLHEICHSLIYEHLHFGSEASITKDDEFICDFFGSSMYQVIRDNEELIEWITD